MEKVIDAYFLSLMNNLPDSEKSHIYLHTKYKRQLKMFVEFEGWN